MHAQNAKLALKHGKHVLVEKAFTLNAREAREVVDLAASKKLVVMEAMWTRFLPHMVRMREVLASGVLGEVRSLIADHTQDLPDDPAHRLNAPELGGGALLDLAIYPISLSWDVFGAPTTIQSSAVMKPTGVDGNVATLFTYARGAIAMTFSSSDTAGPCTATILGTEGRIEIGWWWFVPAPLTVYDSENKVIERFEAKINGRGMHYQAAEVERLIRSGQRESTIMPPRQSVAIMECLDTIRAQIGLRYPGE
jgi:predicted dehydrogenase